MYSHVFPCIPQEKKHINPRFTQSSSNPGNDLSFYEWLGRLGYQGRGCQHPLSINPSCRLGSWLPTTGLLGQAHSTTTICINLHQSAQSQQTWVIHGNSDKSPKFFNIPSKKIGMFRKRSSPVQDFRCPEAPWQHLPLRTTNFKSPRSVFNAAISSSTSWRSKALNFGDSRDKDTGNIRQAWCFSTEKTFFFKGFMM